MSANYSYAALDAAIAQSIMVPNDLLPESYRDNRTADKLQRLDRIQKKLAKRDGEPTRKELDRKAAKAEKARRVELYRQQWADHETLAYEPMVSSEANDLASTARTGSLA
jgi:hypothetical protein